jgi:hypothetical protein
VTNLSADDRRKAPLVNNGGKLFEKRVAEMIKV